MLNKNFEMKLFCQRVLVEQCIILCRICASTVVFYSLEMYIENSKVHRVNKVNQPKQNRLLLPSF